MCRRHSFLLDRNGKVYDGLGLTHSHTEIATLHGFASTDHDKLNAYEWQPPRDWNGDKEQVFAGLTVDRQNFEPKASHDKALVAYLLKKFPSLAVWDAPETPDPSLHERTIALGGSDVTVYCHGVYSVTQGRHFAYGSASVEASGSASVKASGSASVEAYGSASVRAYGSASVEAYGSANLTLTYYSRNVSADIGDQAVVIDRLNGNLVVVTADGVLS